MKEVQSFLGFANYYGDFIQGFSEKAHPLKLLTRKKTEWNWTEECDRAFQELKTLLTTAPVLRLPTGSGWFILDTDASGDAIAAVLSQMQGEEGKMVERPVAYGNKSLSDVETRYRAPKAEMLAAVYFIEKFEAFLTRGEFTLRTDNSALSWLKKQTMTNNMAARWIQKLDQCSLVIEHRRREKHQNADGLTKKTEYYEEKDKQAEGAPQHIS